MYYYRKGKRFIIKRIGSGTTVIKRYHDLYKIEQAFRVAKGDLRSRPIFHFKENPIQLPMLICFMPLAVSKHIEISASISNRAFLDLCKKMIEARLMNRITKKEIRMKAAAPQELQKIIAKIL